MNDSKLTNTIQDEQTISRIESEYGHSIKVYDDGFGPLWAYSEVYGVMGVVRASTWEDAYGCCQDEIMDRVPASEEHEAYGFDTPEEMKTAIASAEESGEYPELSEGYEYQPNATGTGIVAYDLNGRDLSELTPELAQRLNLTIWITQED